MVRLKFDERIPWEYQAQRRWVYLTDFDVIKSLITNIQFT